MALEAPSGYGWVASARARAVRTCLTSPRAGRSVSIKGHRAHEAGPWATVGGQRRKVTWMVPLSAVSLVTVNSLSSILRSSQSRAPTTPVPPPMRTS